MGARSGRVERTRERSPVHAQLGAYALTRQRAVLEAGQAHVVAGRRTEHMTSARHVDSRFAHEAEDRVAGTERHGDTPLRHEASADEAARVVA